MCGVIHNDSVIDNESGIPVINISIDIDCLTYELFDNLLDYMVKQGYSVMTKDRYKIIASKYVPIIYKDSL